MTPIDSSGSVSLVPTLSSIFPTTAFTTHATISSSHSEVNCSLNTNPAACTFSHSLFLEALVAPTIVPILLFANSIILERISCVPLDPSIVHLAFLNKVFASCKSWSCTGVGEGGGGDFSLITGLSMFQFNSLLLFGRYSLPSGTLMACQWHEKI
ncbi:hypothetical protein J3R30DRAFT_1241208 [Lentinula aciculospora]|uniref:Uncharacterized protein n=1 Tax=Lentinula aciculospora TaxID=153920 RepID=A0A9W9DH08_9AGAR|nr:hypothetical protein J3R30DRAFT_1241208 [Lentinula aciculospora]